MSLSSDLERYFGKVEASDGLPSLHRPDVLSRLGKTSDFQSFTAALDRLKAEERLLVLLRSLAAHASSLQPRLLNAELVVTFPGSDAITARQTLHVVRQMIAGATTEILVAGYAITDAGGVLSQIVKAATRGVRIVLVCSDWKDRSGQTAAMLCSAQWPSGSPRPTIYEYKNDAPDSAGMHIKCLLVDGSDLLVGSANFTYPGLNTNFEMGVRVNGSVARAARVVFEESLRTGRFANVR
jgi:phosphatidylserine/phosphatidylglycerophosphate/cardiolipin synthase-like enzyme